MSADEVVHAELVDPIPLPPEPPPDDDQGAAPVKPVEGMPRLWRATDLKMAEQPRWLAKNRLQRGAINLVVGDEGIGKSLLWVWVAAGVTTGKPLPEFGVPARDPSPVLLVATEDDWSTVVRPRLEVAGADLAMVQVICTDADGSGAPIFPRDLFLIHEAEPAPALVVVDAWLDTVPSALSVRDPQQARQALHPWKELAAVADAAVLLLCHTNRLASSSARDRYGASGELRKKARMTLYAQADEEGQLLVGPEKANTAASIPASRFTISAVQHFAPTSDSDGTVPKLVYAGDSERTARQHVADTIDGDGGDNRQERDTAAKWLREYIDLRGPSVLSADAKRDAAKAGFSERTLQRARQVLRVDYGWIGNPPVTTWVLPANTGNDDAEEGDDDSADHDGVSASSGTAGTAAGQDAMPRYATDTALGTPWHTVADQQGLSALPAVPRTQTPLAQPVPGDPTASTPGMTPLVQQILARNRGRFQPPAGPDRCPACGFHAPTQGHREGCVGEHAETGL